MPNPLLTLEGLRQRAAQVADHRHGQVIMAALVANSRLHRRGVDGCVCAYCRSLPRYVLCKRDKRAGRTNALGGWASVEATIAQHRELLRTGFHLHPEESNP